MLGCPEGGKPRGVGRIVLLQTKSGRSFGYGPPGGEPFDRNCPMAQVKAGRYMAGAVTEELAALRNPLPEPGTVTIEDCYDDVCEQALEQRKRDTLRLEAASDDQQIDPLLLALDDLKAQKEAVDAQIRQLLPYGRVPRQPSLRAGGARPRYRIQLLRGAHRLQRAGDPAGHRADRQGAEPAAPRHCQRRPVSATNGAVRGRRRVWGASEDTPPRSSVAFCRAAGRHTRPVVACRRPCNRHHTKRSPSEALRMLPGRATSLPRWPANRRAGASRSTGSHLQGGRTAAASAGGRGGAARLMSSAVYWSGRRCTTAGRVRSASRAPRGCRQAR